MNRIKCLRTYNRLSQSDFATIFHVDQTAVSNWENDKNSIDIKILEKISEYFKVPMEFVVGKPFKATIPIAEWHSSEREDYNNAPAVVKDLILFKTGRGTFIDEDTIIETPDKANTPQERELLNCFRKIPDDQKERYLRIMRSAPELDERNPSNH